MCPGGIHSSAPYPLKEAWWGELVAKPPVPGCISIQLDPVWRSHHEGTPVSSPGPPGAGGLIQDSYG